MVRSYRADPVERGVVERIVATARRAPSAGFSQGQYFVVVTDEDTRRAIAALGHEDEYVEKGFRPWMSTAPVHVVVGVSEGDYHARYSEPDKLDPDGTETEWPVPYWWVDAGAALMLTLLAAVDEGLAAGFFGVHRLSGLKELLAIPDEVEPIGVVTLGFADDDPVPWSRARGWKPLEKAVHWERWTER